MAFVAFNLLRSFRRFPQHCIGINNYASVMGYVIHAASLKMAADRRDPPPLFDEDRDLDDDDMFSSSHEV